MVSVCVFLFRDFAPLLIPKISDTGFYYTTHSNENYNISVLKHCV